MDNFSPPYSSHGILRKSVNIKFLYYVNMPHYFVFAIFIGKTLKFVSENNTKINNNYIFLTKCNLRNVTHYFLNKKVHNYPDYMLPVRF